MPFAYILHSWHTHFLTFELYLAHPASTVRQIASSIFSHLVSRGALQGHNVSVLVFSLITQSLAAGWQIGAKAETERKRSGFRSAMVSAPWPPME